MKALLLLALLAPSFALGGPTEDETLYLSYRKTLKEPGSRFRIFPKTMSPREVRLALDAVEDTLLAGTKLHLPAIIPTFEWPDLPPKEQARWFRLGGETREDVLVSKLSSATATSDLLYELLLQKFKTSSAKRLVKNIASKLPAEASVYRALKGRSFTPPSAAEVRALFQEYPDIAHFQGGAFAGKPRLFLFCRHDRMYPCLLALRDKDDKPVRVGNTLWTQPGLGLSGYKKPFNERLGNTPSGVHLIKGVMPQADDIPSFGKFRRMILEFAPASPSEVEYKRLLPPAAYSSIWWKEAQIARDVGRGELRIHGTGVLNDQPDLSFYPFISTIGCVAQRELKYGSVDYKDQRLLLDRMMKAQGLDAVYSNETSIQALLYVIDIDERETAVTPADLARLGVE